MSNQDNTTPAFSVENLPVITHQHKPVITTEVMALGYDTQEINIRMNFQRNADRFISGKHYFKLEGTELSAFRDQIAGLRVTESYSQTGLQPSDRGSKNDLRATESGSQMDFQINPKARSLILWTERGAARHAKLLNTDKAWDVFEKLEDAYFNQKTEAGFAEIGLTFNEYFQQDKELRLSVEALGKCKVPGFEDILRARIVRLCHRLGYEVPESVRVKQRNMEDL